MVTHGTVEEVQKFGSGADMERKVLQLAKSDITLKSFFLMKFALFVAFIAEYGVLNIRCLTLQLLLHSVITFATNIVLLIFCY